jgi:hypothetical protein
MMVQNTNTSSHHILLTSRAPINELDGTLGLDGGNGGVDILWNDITTEHQATGHVLSVTRVALGHHVGWLKDRVGDLGNRELLMGGLLARNDRSVTGQHKVDTRVWDKVGLELSDINVERSIETERRSEGRDDLRNETVEVGVRWAFNGKVTAADVVQSLVVKAEGTIGVLEESMSRKDGVVWFHNSGRNHRGRRNSKGELGLATVVNRETLEKEGSETGTGSTTSGVEDEESLKSGAVISELADAIEDRVDDLLSSSVVSTSVVVSSIFLTADDLLRVVEALVRTVTDSITDRWLQVNKDGTWDVLSASSLAEKGGEGIIRTGTGDELFLHGTIGVDSMLQAVQLPAVVTNLDTSLTKVNRDALC